MKSSSKNLLWAIVILLALLTLTIFALAAYNSNNVCSTKAEKFTDRSDIARIAALNDNWIHQVTVKNDPKAVSKLFCPDGSLVGTVSKEIRKHQDIYKYFVFFANLKGIRVVYKKYNIVKVTDSVYVNTAFIKWYWDGLKEPITARMTFIFRDNCIFQLHSSALPELNKALYKISGGR